MKTSELKIRLISLCLLQFALGNVRENGYFGILDLKFYSERVVKAKGEVLKVKGKLKENNETTAWSPLSHFHVMTLKAEQCCSVQSFKM